jgi:hypothetical protein
LASGSEDAVRNDSDALGLLNIAAIHRPQVTGIDDQPYWTPLRRELIQWFKDRAPAFVEGYRAAVFLLYNAWFPGRVRFICHAIRDIYRFLPGSLDATPHTRGGDVLPGMVKELARAWKDFPRSELSGSNEVRTDFAVSPQVYSHLQKLVEKSKEITKVSIGEQLAISLFRSLDRQSDQFLEPWIHRSFQEEHDFFVARAHFSKNADKKACTEEDLLAHFEAFERAFHSLVGPYFRGKEELDALLQDTNEVSD